jgi:hypothetical protein
MSRVRSGPLAAWTSAWLAGRIGPDEVADAVSLGDAPHRVLGLGPDPVPLHDALVALRRTGEPVRVALPVAGDVRGMPAAPADFRTAALEAGETVFAGDLALVPAVTSFAPSSAPPTVVWRVFVVSPALPDPLQLEDASYELSLAIRESASALAAGELASGVTEGLAQARRAGERVNLPPGFSPRAVALLAQAERLQAVLDLAGAHPASGVITRHEEAARREALRPLATAVRRARVAAYNAGAGW